MDNSRPKTVGFTTVALVHQDVLRLVVQRKTYRQLYEDPGTVKILNAVAPTTFGTIQDALRQEMALGVSRTLIDPAVQFGHSNLGLKTLITRMPGDHSDLLNQVHKLRERYQPIWNMRRKLRAHRDEVTAYAITHREESAISAADDDLIFSAITDMKRLMGDVLSRLPVGNPYDDEVEGPDADKLVAALSPV